MSHQTEVIVSLGAIQTLKLLMQSGIGDQAELGKFGNSAAPQSYAKREVATGNLRQASATSGA